MKILIINYRYFVSGGPERYMFNIMEILKDNGHEVIPFSVKSKHNSKSKYEKYFLSPIGDGTAIYADEYDKKNLLSIYKIISRVIYSFEAKRKLKRLVKLTKPDIAYLLIFNNKMSCSIIDTLYKFKIPIVNRISDFGLICGTNIFYRYDTKNICEKCLAGSKINIVRYKCVKNSIVYSTIKMISIYLQKLLRIKDKVDKFVFPSVFTAQKYADFGIEKNKIAHIPTFFNTNHVDANCKIEYEDFLLYIGRVDEDKGIMTLLRAFVETNMKLIIVGKTSNRKFQEEINNFLCNKKHNISFKGELEFSEISKYLAKCLCTVVPSEWYDNFPNTILESFAYNKCVIASDLGSLKEIIDNGSTGLLFELKNHLDLREKAQSLFDNKNVAIEYGRNAYKILLKKYLPELHFNSLITLFENLINAKKNNK